MVQFYLIPRWFFGYGLALELIFAAITFAVALYALLIYKYSRIRECKLFSLGFFLLSFSYLSWAAVGIYLFGQASSGTEILSIDDVTLVASLGVYGHIALFVLGLVTLTYMTLRKKAMKTFTLIASLSYITIIFSTWKIIAFYFVSSLLLFYVVIYYIGEYAKNRKSTSLFVMLAFIFLFLGTADFAFSAAHHVNYVIGHVLHLIGYASILVSFIETLRPLKYGKKT